MTSPEPLARLESRSPDETLALGRALGRGLAPGSGVALVGELGAGKTLCARGIALGLGVDEPEAVVSPSYLVCVEHEGPIPLFHVDAYFGARGRALLELEGTGWLAAGGVLVVEWPERLGLPLPADFLRVEITHAGPTRRLFTVFGAADRWSGPLSRLGSGARDCS